MGWYQHLPCHCFRPRSTPLHVTGTETAEGDPREDSGAGEAVFNAGRPRSELHYPGVYRSVCVTLRLHHLAVAAVEAAEALAELEGGAVGGAGGAGAGGAGVGSGVFKVLRALQAAWIRDATANRNMCVRGG